MIAWRKVRMKVVAEVQLVKRWRAIIGFATNPEPSRTMKPTKATMAIIRGAMT